MPADTATIDPGPAADGQAMRGGKVRLLTLDALDGRTRAAQAVRETRAEVMADLGGADQLSTLERLAVDHVAMLAAMLRDAGVRWLQGEAIDPAAIGALVNTFNRSAATLGWQRRARDVTPDLRTYMADRAAEREGEAA